MSKTAGLLPSVIVAAASLAVLLPMWRLHWLAPMLVHSSAALSLVWALLAWLFTYRSTKAADLDSSLHDWIAVLRIAALVLGLLAFIPMLYDAVLEANLRTLFAGFKHGWHADIWPTGIVDLALLAAALLAGRAQTGERGFITALFWLTLFAGLWMSLRLPAARPVLAEGGVIHWITTGWSAAFMTWSAITIGVFTLVGGCIEHEYRRSAWPNRLWRLTTPLPHWPGSRYSAGLAGVVVLILGLVHVTMIVTPLSAGVAGAAILALVGRRWEENLADVGLALVTLAVVSLATVWRPIGFAGPEYFAEIFNRVLIGLGIMAAFWHWLAHVWTQQLDHGRPWTTAGLLIRPARRVGYLVSSSGLLVSASLALWPLLPYAGPDHSVWRWAWGPAANLLFVLALAFSAARTGKPTLAWLCVLAVVSAIAFVLNRLPGSAASLGWANYWPVVSAGMAIICLPLAGLVRNKNPWRPFWEPLYLSGIVILPILAATGALLIADLHLPMWVPSATFLCLAVAYLLAALLPGPRGFLIVAIVCAAMGVFMRV